ncbi:Gfo/Idh/MocA family oxidoreductase [Hymenobacter sp. BT770]|uniref:Gfo/Idh/MocA family protein n=1 Tax=Hymenobacter sp. BT770 TaxID=2886942 RepID=UPI001D11D761|nr:Gfo/Idh/MocA family oxidoreductase [Hymenobacter sp. BT770]MCC3154419.1 Gfo/Idh/MocA family oxidoreductase [Hymenobacter sp. BT770]MDO3416290.1 Gfo/Idh/MocA family oxidoreductase [Hymenobacter sp. BT770]
MRLLSLGAGATIAGPAALAGPLRTLADGLTADRKLGVALVGLGKYSTGELAPALQQTKLCRLAGIVTGSPAKAARWKQQYNLPDNSIYDYKTFDRIIDNPDIDIVYVVLPNALHAEYVVRAAQAGKHVICEKPMATSVADARRMIAAMQQAGKKLSIGYRLHFEPHHREMMRLGQQQVFGPVQHLLADNGFRFNNDTPWRVNKALSGGGPLMDMGIYCLQGCIYTKGQVPVSVTAKFTPKTDPVLFREVEAGVNWQLQFADGATADCRTTYAENMASRLRAEATKGWAELAPAFGYGGLQGRTSQSAMNIPNVNQQAAQMDDFADCVLHNKLTRVPGEMGLRDVQLLEAIYRAAETGQKVSTKDVAAVLDKVGKK